MCFPDTDEIALQLLYLFFISSFSGKGISTVITHMFLFQVDMSKVNADSLKPWIASRITELLGMEDDVVVEFVYNQLDARVRLICLVSFELYLKHMPHCLHFL